MENNISGKESLICKLKNVLRGDAMSIIDATYMSFEDKKERMKTIEEIKIFLDDYDNNMKILKEAKKIKDIER